MNLRSLFPLFSSFDTYSKTDFKGDLVAGLTVGVMLIPQGMAYAMIAGLPPIYGLYAAIVPLVLYAILGTSRQLAVGPVAMVALLVAAGVSTMAEVGSEQYIALAITLALLVGIIQFLMGVLKLGFLVKFLSHPVISGFTSAAALIIGINQIKHLVGINLKGEHIHQILIETIRSIHAIHWLTLAIGFFAILILFSIKRFKVPVPGALAVVFLGVLSVWLFGWADQGVKIIGEIPKGLPSFALPVLNLALLQQLLPIAFTIAFIGFMESIAVAKAIQTKHGNYKVIPNQELIALGIANIGGAFFQAFPTTGGFSRTAVNDQAGAKTGLASIISAGLIVLTLLFLTPLFYYLPKAVLAAVIIMAVIGLVDLKAAKRLWKTDRSDFWMLLSTFVVTLAIGIEEGILTGVVLSLGMVIYRTSEPHYAVLGKIPGKPHYRNLARFDDLEDRKEGLIIRFDARLYFANASFFEETIDGLIRERLPLLKFFILDADSINGIDSSGIHALEQVYETCEKHHINFYVVGLKGPVRDQFNRSGLYQKIGEDHFFFRIQHAVDYFDSKKNHIYQKYILQVEP
ncbi:MAG: solute carrier family 26 protein [Saprospiraceae bacterium]